MSWDHLFLGYAPSFEKYYDTYASDATGTITKQYSRFEGGIFGSGLTNLILLVWFKQHIWSENDWQRQH
jgi:hypothetical protein